MSKTSWNMTWLFLFLFCFCYWGSNLALDRWVLYCWTIFQPWNYRVVVGREPGNHLDQHFQFVDRKIQWIIHSSNLSHFLTNIQGFLIKTFDLFFCFVLWLLSLFFVWDSIFLCRPGCSWTCLDPLHPECRNSRLDSPCQGTVAFSLYFKNIVNSKYLFSIVSMLENIVV